MRPVTRIHPENLPALHELKSWPDAFDGIKRGITRATIRRADDRVFQVGDRITFVLATASGAVVQPRQEIDAVIVRATRMAGPHQLLGSDGTQTPELVPMILIHFALEQIGPARGTDADDWHKVLSFAAAAGDTITEGEALVVIRSIARLHRSSARGES
jgi:Domain of unknown function (DUF3850)